MKKTTKSFGSGDGFKSVVLRKKKWSGTLEDSLGKEKLVFNSLETSDTTESDSIDMEEECLVEETSFNYGEDIAFADGDLNQMPKGSKIKTKKALSKPLGKINFSVGSDKNSVLFNTLLMLSSSLKNLVNVSVRKSFVLDISLDNVAEKSAQDKLAVIRKLFSKINGFRRTSTSSKFFGIIQTTFTSELDLMKATEKTADAKIVVNTDFKKSTGCSDWAVVIKKIPVETSTETVYAALSEFGVIKLIKIQLVRLWQKAIIKFKKQSQADLLADRWSILIGKDIIALFYTLPVGTNAHDIWDFIGSVGEKTCVINHHLVIYTKARCAVVCFESAKSLDAIMGITPILRSDHLCWFYLGSATCTKCGRLGHTSLGCGSDGKLSSGRLLRQVLSDFDKSRLATIYAKHSAPVTWPVAFGGASWASIVSGSFFPSFSGQNVSSKIGSSSEMKLISLVFLEMNDRFVTLECSLTSLAEHVDKLAKRLDTSGPMVFQLSSGSDIVISESLGVVTSGETVVKAVVFDLLVVLKMEETLRNLSVTIWFGKLPHVIRFDGVWVFTSGLNSGYLGASVVIVMNFFLVKHVYKISEVLGRLLYIKLLFKNKLSVSILGLYAGVSLVVWFSQANKINVLIVKAVNKSSFIVLGG
ncbi:hypothetical protein G9A89_003767 [Geosiphon pyriformis]|nr:hypothetical protein G9A89_003767 [Geosiphon pyriformis]